MAQTIMYIIPLLGIVGLLFTYFKSNWVENKMPAQKNANYSQSYLRRGYGFLKS